MLSKRMAECNDYIESVNGCWVCGLDGMRVEWDDWEIKSEIMENVSSKMTMWQANYMRRGMGKKSRVEQDEVGEMFRQETRQVKENPLKEKS